MRSCQRLLVALILVTVAEADFMDYVRSVGSYFSSKNSDENDLSGEFTQRIPYEVSAVDEKFISEAAKLTGVALSELDTCQQRVVMKLRTDCQNLNDEQLAKMAVHLLNCQSFAEGRRIYPCTDDMSIKSCTKDMDSDTWTSYHLMSNRARAVCYQIRQMQFRGMAEHTVNRLMETAQTQLKTLNQITQNQEDLHDIAENTFNSLAEGHKLLTQQQKDIQQAQFHGQLVLEDNIKKLSIEKQLIMETHNHLLELTRNIQKRLEASTKQIGSQVEESRQNHQELIDDLIGIQNKAQIIFERIDESSELLLKQNEDFKRQYESTLRNLAEVNKTVHNLVALVGGTRQVLEERLNWILTALGGTDMAVERLYLIIWHTAFLILSMVTCAFISARSSTRIAVATIPPLNLAFALFTEEQQLGPLGLTAAILTFVLVQAVLLWSVTHKKRIYGVMSWSKPQVHANGTPSTITLNNNVDSSTANIQAEHYEYISTSQYKSYIGEDDDDRSDVTFSRPTPPRSRSGFYNNRNQSRSSTPLRSNGTCRAKTRMGTPCKLTSAPGRDYCHRHQTGDSILG